MTGGVPRDEETDLLAAEYVLSLLEGNSLRRARVRATTDPDFAAAIDDWQRRLTPLGDEIAPVAPGPELWDRIRNEVQSTPRGTDNVVTIEQSRGRWRAYAAAMTAVAAALTLLLGYQAGRDPTPVVPSPVPAAAPVMVASLASAGEPTALVVSYDPGTRMLMIMPTRLADRPGRAHQLWIIPAGGSPVSLGMIRAGDAERRSLPASIARHFRAAATLAVSVEPAGGSPTGLPTGPVVATGPWVTI